MQIRPNYSIILVTTVVVMAAFQSGPLRKLFYGKPRLNLYCIDNEVMCLFQMIKAKVDQEMGRETQRPPLSRNQSH